jgi:hypothetical protein
MVFEGSGRPWALLAASTWLWAAACSMPDYKIAEPMGDGMAAFHCDNGLLDLALGETDFDCGGGCEPCEAGRNCTRDVDCVDGFCNRGTCMAPGCTNGVRDGRESSIDCGGSECPKCIAGAPCSASGDCQSLLCDASHCLAAACDDGLQNGSETGLDCGGPCQPCPAGNPECAMGRADCNQALADGCEIELLKDVEHCGACGRSCEILNASQTLCSAGACSPTCEPGFAACSSRELGCTTQLGTDENCSKCGEMCDAGAPFCTSTGCQSALDLSVEGPGVRSMKAWNGVAFGAEIALDHPLVHGKGSGRVVLVGVSASGTGSGPFSVTYDDQPMVKAVEIEHESRQTYAAIYYLLDAQLPAQAATSNQARVVFSTGQWWGYGGIDVLEVVNAQQDAPLVTNTAVGANCSPQTTRGVTLTFDAPGSLVYGVLSSRGSPSPPTLQQAPPLTKTWSQNVDNGGAAQSAGAGWVIDDDTRNLQWGLENCDTSAVAGVVLERLHVAAAPKNL